MSKTIRVELSTKSINSAIKELNQYKTWIAEKEIQLRRRLAELGADVARIQFAGATYDGVNDVTVRVDDSGSVAVIYAEGEAVAFIEFGAGAKYGYGHPQAGLFGVGPGTYPEPKNPKNWNRPTGWFYKEGDTARRTFGNPPAKAMVNARDEILANITRIAREVFA